MILNIDKRTVLLLQAFLANEDLGDSLDSVEALFKKHDDFEKSLAAQEEKIKALDEFATKLIENEHYAADDVASRRDQVRDRNLTSGPYFAFFFLLLYQSSIFLNFLRKQTTYEIYHNLISGPYFFLLFVPELNFF